MTLDVTNNLILISDFNFIIKKFYIMKLAYIIPMNIKAI
jgi:hypothetical protein